MKFAALLILSAALCQAVPQWGGHGGGKKAIYFLRVDPQGSSVVSIAINSEGQLIRLTKSTSTGGVGLQSQNYTAPGMVPVGIDPLQGQQSVSVGRNYLFTINSGSNTAVMFRINPQNPIELTMVGEPVATLGEFPMSIAYSAKYNKACVLNGGASNGVACYSATSKGLIPDVIGLRPFGFPATTPPQLGGPSGSGSDIQFSTDSSKLITTFKGTSKPATLGHVTIFNVDDNGKVSSTFTDNDSNQEIAVPFGFALSGADANDFFVTDVTVGGGNLVSLNSRTNKISVLATVNNTAFAATCWSVWSSSSEDYFVLPAGTPNMGNINPAGDLVRTLDFNPQLGGVLDAVVDGPLAYFLNHLNSIAVINLETGKLMQRFEYASSQNRPYWTGMAMYPASSILTGGIGA